MNKILILLLIPVLLFGQLIDEGFEGSGAPSGWTTAIGTPNYDYTTNALEQTQSIFLDASGGTSSGAISAPFTATAETWHFFIVYWDINDGVGDNTCYYIRNADNTGELARLILYRDGRLRLDVGTPAPLSSGSYADSTTYCIWIRYQAGTGANAEYDLYIAEYTTPPISRPVTPVITGTNGTQVGNCGRVMYYATTLGKSVFDAVKVSATEIGNYTIPITSTEKTNKFTTFNGYSKW